MVVGSGGNSYVKEMAIRKRIASIQTEFINVEYDPTTEFRSMNPILSHRLIPHEYNKREEDFPSLREYNDYLEEVEDMTFSLVEGIDVAAIESEIVKYQEENAEQIILARARKAEELAAALSASKGGAVRADTTDAATSQSYTQAGGSGVSGHYMPAMPGGTLGQPRPTGMVTQPVPLGSGGFDLHTYAIDDEETMKLRAERGGRAGGWTVEISKRRAMEEAFSCIY